MGAPAINYSAPRVAAQNITAPAPSLNVNQALGLSSSPYSGLQQVGGQNLYYDEGGGFYESYSPSPRRYGRMIYGQFSPVTGPFGTSYVPSYSPIFGYGGGITATGGDEAGTIRKDGQAFKPYSGDIPTGFIETDEGIYKPSMAYIYSQQMPQVAMQPNRTFSTVPGYQAAVGNLLGNLAMSGTSGAGRFLGGNVPALNLGTPSGKTAAK
jgi:hypothetical protein